jgi:hypothetical protein
MCFYFFSGRNCQTGSVRWRHQTTYPRTSSTRRGSGCGTSCPLVCISASCADSWPKLRTSTERNRQDTLGNRKYRRCKSKWSNFQRRKSKNSVKIRTFSKTLKFNVLLKGFGFKSLLYRSILISRIVLILLGPRNEVTLLRLGVENRLFFVCFLLLKSVKRAVYI